MGTKRTEQVTLPAHLVWDLAMAKVASSGKEAAFSLPVALRWATRQLVQLHFAPEDETSVKLTLQTRRYGRVQSHAVEASISIKREPGEHVPQTFSGSWELLVEFSEPDE